MIDRILSIRPRWMIRRDMPDVLEIEQLNFEVPWTEDDFVRCLRQRNCIGMVAEHDKDVVGFMVYEMYKTRMEILDLAVHPSCQHRGIGKQLVDFLIARLATQRRNCIGALVWDRNLSAQLFFSALGFMATGLVDNFYQRGDRSEAAYAMEYRPQEKWLPRNRVKESIA